MEFKTVSEFLIPNPSKSPIRGHKERLPAQRAQRLSGVVIGIAECEREAAIQPQPERRAQLQAAPGVFIRSLLHADPAGKIVAQRSPQLPEEMRPEQMGLIKTR